MKQMECTDDVRGIRIVSDDEAASDGNPVNDHESDSGESHLEDSDQVTQGLNGGWWYLDTASNSHVTGNFAEFMSYTADSEQLQQTRGVTPTIASRVAGMGTVSFTTEVNGEQVVSYLDGVLYIPDAEYGLFSPVFAYEQGYTLEYDRESRNFHVMRDGRTVAVATQQEATWGFQVASPTQRARVLPEAAARCNHTMAEGVGSLQLWHERLCHICPQYLKTMVDKGGGNDGDTETARYV